MAMPHEHHHDAEMVWEPCGACWGQRVIWHPRPGGGGLRAESCEGCLGVGARAVVVAAAARGARAAS
jgi:hypothetical protein